MSLHLKDTPGGIRWSDHDRQTLTEYVQILSSLMPRISRRLLAQARSHHPFLPQLLRPCRDLESAKLEFKWLREHVIAERAGKFQFGRSAKWLARLRELCEARGRGVPLQYLLGTEYFGDLKLRCEHGVLIPRPATAAAVMSLLEWLKRGKVQMPRELKLLDLCTGTGCISLLFGHSFPFNETQVEDLSILGVDISPTAIQLAKLNRKEVLNQLHIDRLHPTRDKALQVVAKTEFKQSDIFTLFKSSSSDNKWIFSSQIHHTYLPRLSIQPHHVQSEISSRSWLWSHLLNHPWTTMTKVTCSSPSCWRSPKA